MVSNNLLNGVHISPSDVHPIFCFMDINIESPFKYSFLGDSNSTTPTVYKIWVNGRFLIWKGKSFHNSVHHASVDIEKMIRKGPRKDHAFTNLIKFMKKSGSTYFEVEKCFTSDNPLEILKAEHKMLTQEEGNPLCLNFHFNTYIPSWVDPAVADEFKKWKN